MAREVPVTTAQGAAPADKDNDKATASMAAATAATAAGEQATAPPAPAPAAASPATAAAGAATALADLHLSSPDSNNGFVTVAHHEVEEDGHVEDAME